MRSKLGCSMLATPTTFANVWPAVRFCTPGRVVPIPVWQTEQMGVKICVCNCVSVTVAGAVFATVTVLTAEDPTLPSASVAVALRLTDPSGTGVVVHETVYGAAAATPKEVLPAKNSTFATLSESFTVALRVTVPFRDPVGVVKVTTGGALRTGAVAPASMRP